MGVPTQSSKGLRVATQCRDVEQFVRAFHRYCEDSGVFISHARRSVGEVIAFSFELADGSPALTGLGAVIEQFPTAENRFGRPGVVIALHRLTRSARRVFDDLTAARAAAPEYVDYDKTDVTPIPFAEARAVTCNIQMLDPDNLTPIPQMPPRAIDAFPTLKPPPAEEPDLPAPPPKVSRAATQSIAAIEIRPPARTPAAAIKIPTIGASTPPVVARTSTTPFPRLVTPPAGQPIASTPPTTQTPPVVARTRTPVVAVPVVEAPRAPVVARTQTPPAAVPVVEAPRAPVLPSAAVVEPPRKQPTPAAAVRVIEEPEAVVEDHETIPEPTVRMATPPHGAVIAPDPEPPASIIDTPRAYERGNSEVAPLSPAPLELLSAPAEHVAEPATPPAMSAHAAIEAMVAEASGPAVVAHSEPLVATPAPEEMRVVFARQPTRAPASTRWTKRRIWAVSALAGAALLALGIVIGATFVAGASRDSTRSSEVSTGSPTPAAASPTAAPTAASPTASATPPAASPTASATPPAGSPTAAAAPAATAPAEAPTEAPSTGPATAAATPAAPATPTEASPTPASPNTAPPAEAPVATAAQPAHGVAKTPAKPPKKPPHKHHSHSKPAGCTSLNCL